MNTTQNQNQNDQKILQVDIDKEKARDSFETWIKVYGELLASTV